MNGLQFFKFALVGTLGFGVDIGSIYVILNSVAISPLWARLPAWLLAVTTTYILNIMFTFSQSRTLPAGRKIFIRRYIPYVVSQLSGGAVNVGVYSILLLTLNAPVYVAIAAGTLFGLIFNFMGASLVIKGHIVSCKIKKK